MLSQSCPALSKLVRCRPRSSVMGSTDKAETVMSLREWLIIIGALVILGVLLDGVRRMIRARQDAREFSQGMGGSDLSNSPLDEDFNPELPNGGSRVIQPGVDSGDGPAVPPRRQERPATVYKPTHPVTDRAPRTRTDDAAPQPESEIHSQPDHEESDSQEPSHSPEPLDKPFQAVPQTDDDLSLDTANEINHSQWDPEPGFADTQESDGFSLSADERPERGPTEPAGSTVDEITQGAKTLWSKLRSGAQSVTQSMEKSMPEKDRKGGGSGERATVQDGVNAGRRPDPASSSPGTASGDGSAAPLAGANRPPAEEVIVVNVHCKGDERLPGPALKRLFEVCGLEYGDLGIYHRHEEPDTRSPVQFSVANAVSPGTFTPEEMQDMATPGISFFLSLPGPDDSMQAFEFMMETAQTVVRNLGGELRDEQRSVMTGQTIEHCRQCIREFERRQHFVRS